MNIMGSFHDVNAMFRSTLHESVLNREWIKNIKLNQKNLLDVRDAHKGGRCEGVTQAVSQIQTGFILLWQFNWKWKK